MCFGPLSLSPRSKAALYPAVLRDAGLFPPTEARTRALAGKRRRPKRAEVWTPPTPNTAPGTATVMQQVRGLGNCRAGIFVCLGECLHSHVQWAEPRAVCRVSRSSKSSLRLRARCRRRLKALSACRHLRDGCGMLWDS